ncbi:MAG TPA: hypothetical protein VGH98_04880 [Gemmatimonadaceae bacterium]|jgi:hypothetical protein
MHRNPLYSLAIAIIAAAGCSSHDSTTGPNTTSFANNPCSISGTLQLSVAQTAVADCTNGGTTLTVAGNGASYLVVAQFPVDLVPDNFVQYHVSSGTAISASLGLPKTSPFAARANNSLSSAAAQLAIMRPRAKQLAFDRMLRGRARQQLESGRWKPSLSLSRAVTASKAQASISATSVPALGSVRNFQVLSNATGTATSTVSARLAYSGTDVLIYVDTLAPANGFTSAQLQAFGQLFDQTLYPIDIAAFGPPSDIDQNGHVIMLMTPVVNGLTSTADCASGYVAGFFDEEDLGGGPNDPTSNNGEIFYSIVPDPNHTKSCTHSVDDVGSSVPAVFMHELQHLISFSQHVLIHGGDPEYGWLDEGLSIVAEELGSLYYENKCPGTACRTDPSQLFPDSSQGFISDFLYDSYQYALLPDTASVTLHSDADDGFSWRGGDWLLMRWLGDQMGPGIFKRLDENTLTGVANIVNVSGQSFPSLFANFGLSLVTDSLPGQPRTLAPAADRFVTRNVRQLWNRLYVTSGGSSDVPLPYPVQLFAITGDTSTAIMDPGTGSYFRLDTPTSAATVTIQFAGPGGAALPAAVHPQLSIFRLPSGQ